MVTLNLGNHIVRVYDGIEDLPIVRYHKYQKFALIDAGIGSDIASLDRRLEKTRIFTAQGRMQDADRELENLRQCVFFIQSEVSPRNLSFAALVAEIDGEPVKDITDESLREVCRKLQDVPESEIAAQIEAVKKKIDDELTLFFPALFEGSELKEYYGLMRKRILAVLAAVQRGEWDSEEVHRATDELLTFSKPKQYTGPEGAEVEHERQFENICLVMSERLHVDPKGMKVQEFYNAYEFLQEQGKREKAAKSGRISR